MYRRAILIACAALFSAQSAFALTPGQRAALLGQSIPAWVTQGAGVPAMLDFNFALNQYYQRGQINNVGTLLNVSRASAGAAVSSTGVWTQFPASAPRITDLGLLAEEARTNGVRNNSMQGAVPGVSVPTNWAFTAAGLTTSIVAVGTQNGINFVDIRATGTPTGVTFQIRYDALSAIAAVQNQPWTHSVFLAFVGGSLTNVNNAILQYNEYNSSVIAVASHVNTDFKASVPASLGTTSRFSLTATTTNAATAFVAPIFDVGLTIGQAVDFTVRVGWPQMEQGATITSPIRTTNAAVTRAADVISLANLPTFGAGWSFFVNGSITEVSGVRSLLGTSVANNQPIYSPSSNTLADANNGTVALAATAGSGGWTTGAKAAAGFSSTGRSIVANNGTVATDANVHIAPTTLYLGGTAGTVLGSKTISRFAVWDQRLTDTALKALTQ